MRPSGRGTFKASSGSSVPQKIVDVVLIRISNEVREATCSEEREREREREVDS